MESQTQQGPAARMSEDQVASAAETAPEDDSVIPNGKGHEPGEGTATSTPPAGNEEKWVFSHLTAFFPGLKIHHRILIVVFS